VRRKIDILLKSASPEQLLQVHKIMKALLEP
jgi:hypothetical protein